MKTRTRDERGFHFACRLFVYCHFEVQSFPSLQPGAEREFRLLIVALPVFFSVISFNLAKYGFRRSTLLLSNLKAGDCMPICKYYPRFSASKQTNKKQNQSVN